MQEPILTRWKTVGEAARYIHKHFDVLVYLVSAVCNLENNDTKGIK